MIIRTKVLYSTSACSVFLVGSEEYYFALDVAKNKERNLGCVIHTAAWLARLESAGLSSGRSRVQTPAGPKLRVFK